MIRATRTTSQGVTFRSKLESRWAHFLTLLSIPWRYEPELIDLGELRYLPDFRLPSYWLEIKGEMGTDQNGLTIVKKCEILSRVSSAPVILAFYDPMAARCAAFLPDGAMYQAHFGMCSICGGLAVKGDGFAPLCTHPNALLTMETERLCRRLIFDAAVAARNI